MLTQLLTSVDMSASILRLQNYGRLSDIPTMTPEIRRAIQEARAKIREIEKDAHAHRRAELEEAEASAQAAKAGAKAKHIRHLISGEQMRQVTQMMNRLQNEGDGRSLNRLEVPTNPEADPNDPATTQWKLVDSPEEIVQYVQQPNQQHFGQAHGIFPTTTFFTSQVDWAASTHEAELILHGSFDNSSCSHIEKLLLKHMEKATTLDSVKEAITEEEWVGKMRVWRESTQSSPSGMHLGHHKSLVREFLPDHDMVATKAPSAPTARDLRMAQPVEAAQLQQLTLHDWIILVAQERPTLLATDPPTPMPTAPANEPTPIPTRGFTYNQLRASLLSSQLAIVNYCIRHAYSLQRWRKGLST
jgi:hypothetical protein